MKKGDTRQKMACVPEKRVLPQEECVYYLDSSKKIQRSFSQYSPAKNGLIPLKEDEQIEYILSHVIVDNFGEVCRFFFSQRVSQEKIITIFLQRFFAACHQKGFHTSAREKSIAFVEKAFLSFFNQFQENITLSFATVYRVYQYDKILESREKIIHHSFDFFINNYNVIRTRSFSVPLYAQRKLVVSFFIKKILNINFMYEFIKQRIFVEEKKILSTLLQHISCIEKTPQIWHDICEIFFHDFDGCDFPQRLRQIHLFFFLEKNLPNTDLFQAFKKNLLCYKQEKIIQKYQPVFEKIMLDETVSLQERCTIFKNLAQRLLDRVYAEFGLPGDQKVDFLKKIYQALLTCHVIDPFFSRAIQAVLHQQKTTTLATQKNVQFQQACLQQASVLAEHFSFLPLPFVLYSWLLWHRADTKAPRSGSVPVDTLIYFSMYCLCVERYDVSLIDDHLFFSFVKTYLCVEKINDVQNMIHTVLAYDHQHEEIDIFPHFTHFIRCIAKNDVTFLPQATRKIAALARCVTDQIVERVCKESTILTDMKHQFARDEPFLSIHLAQLDCAMRTCLEQSFALLQRKNLVLSRHAFFKYIWSYLMEDIHAYDKEEITKSIYRGIVMKCAEEYGCLLQDFCHKNFIFDEERHYVYDGVIRSFYANVHHCTAVLGLATLSERDINRLSVMML